MDGSPLAPAPRPASVYNRTFWMAYAANVALVTANALTFRFAEMVAWLGGTEQVAGDIVSTGFVVAVVVRLAASHLLDHYGTRRLWLATSVFFICGALLLVATSTLGWQIYAARMLFTVGITGMFATSMTHIQNQVPPHRRTEIIGTLGTSGFVGLVAGAQIGDWLFNHMPEGRPQYLALFGGTAALGVVYFVLVAVLTRKDSHLRPHETPPAFRLLYRYWPGTVVLVAMVMGLGVTVTTVFLTRYATHLGLKGIGTFFTGYSSAAFLFRLATGRWSRTLGRHRMILLGLLGHCVGHWSLLLVVREWHFLLPALLCGFGHALLFPSVVSLGAGAFPPQYRGSGTALILCFTDVGAIVFSPILGRVIDSYGFVPTFLLSGSTALAVAVIYRLTAGRKPDDEAQLPAETPQLEPAAASEDVDSNLPATPPRKRRLVSRLF